MSAEGGSAWTHMYPDYTVVVPRDVFLQIPVAFPMGRNDVRLAEVPGGGLELKKRDGAMDKLYEH